MAYSLSRRAIVAAVPALLLAGSRIFQVMPAASQAAAAYTIVSIGVL